MFSREKLGRFAVRMCYATIFAERIQHTAWLAKKSVVPAHNQYDSQYEAERNVCIII